jgi:hypothetical protein
MMRIRQPGRHLTDWITRIVPAFRDGRVAIELTDWVERTASSVRTVYSWFDIATGEATQVYYEYRPFELEVGDALVAFAGGDVNLYVLGFTDDNDARQGIDIARDAVLEGREGPATRILREALPHGWPLCMALLRRERNLLGANRP